MSPPRCKAGARSAAPRSALPAPVSACSEPRDGIEQRSGLPVRVQAQDALAEWEMEWLGRGVPLDELFSILLAHAISTGDEFLDRQAFLEAAIQGWQGYHDTLALADEAYADAMIAHTEN